MNLSKKSKYLPIILLLSIVLVALPQFSFAASSGLGAAADWLAEKLGFIVWLFAIKFPSIILLLEIKMFAMVGPYNGFTTQTQVVQAWGTVRDLANMFFILILLLMAFGTILQVQGYGYKQMLSKLLLMAILINFSKSIVAILVDFSQIVTLTFLAPVIYSLSGSVIVSMGLQNIMNLKDKPSTEGDGYTSVSYLMAMILGGIMMIITTVIMGVILIMFVLRIIGIWIMIILAPLAFLSRAFPKMNYLYSQWESELSKNLTTGPALAFFMWLAFSIVGQGNVSQQFTAQSGTADGSQYVDDSGGFSTAVSKVADQSNMLNFVIAISLLMAGLKFAASSGVAGASVAGQASRNLQKWGSRIGRGATIGAAAGAGALAWRGTSGEGGIKGGIGTVRGLAGKGLTSTGEAWKIGGLQRVGMSMTNREDKRRQKKEDYFAKRLEGMSSDEKQKYVDTYKGKVSKYLLGGREAAGLSQKNKLDRGIEVADLDPHNMTDDQRMQVYGQKDLDKIDQAEVNKKKADRYEQMRQDFERVGDKASLEKLRKRSLVSHNKDSFRSHLDQNGLMSLATVDPSVMDPLDDTNKEVVDMVMAHSSKELGELFEKMSPKIRDSWMKALQQRNDTVGSEFEGEIENDKSAAGKFAILQSRFATKRTGMTDGFGGAAAGTSITARYANLKASDKDKAEKLLNNVLANASGGQISGIDESSELFKDASGNANITQANELITKNANNKAKIKAITQNQVRNGNISNMMANNTARRYIEDTDAKTFYDTESTNMAEAAGHAKGTPTHDAEKLSQAHKLARQNLSHAHVAFNFLPSSEADKQFATLVNTLNREQLSKLDGVALDRIKTLNPGGIISPAKLIVIDDI